MKIHRASWVLVMVIVAAGCAQKDPGFIEAPPNIAMVGSANDSYTNNDTTKRPVTLATPVETRGVMAFDVLKTDTSPVQDYLVVFGTSKNEFQSAKGFFRQKPHPLPPFRSVAWFHLSGNCWVYLYGEGPMVETDVVEAGSEGSDSDLLVEIVKVNNEIVHRVYFKVGSVAWVKNRKDRGNIGYETLAPGEFVEARYDGSVSTPAPIPEPDADGGPIEAFLYYVNCQKQPFKK